MKSSIKIWRLETCPHHNKTISKFICEKHSSQKVCVAISIKDQTCQVLHTYCFLRILNPQRVGGCTPLERACSWLCARSSTFSGNMFRHEMFVTPLHNWTQDSLDWCLSFLFSLMCSWSFALTLEWPISFYALHNVSFENCHVTIWNFVFIPTLWNLATWPWWIQRALSGNVVSSCSRLSRQNRCTKFENFSNVCIFSWVSTEPSFRCRDYEACWIYSCYTKFGWCGNG